MPHSGSTAITRPVARGPASSEAMVRSTDWSARSADAT